MSRSTPEIPRPPFRSSGVVLSADRPRLTIPSRVRECVEWLRGKKAPLDCILGLGSHRQIVVSSARSRLATRRKAFFDAVEKEPGLLEVAEGPRLARYFAATWSCVIQAQFQLTLPEALVKSWLLGTRGVTLIGLADTLEIWTPGAWAEEVGNTARDYDSLLADLLDAAGE